MKITTVNVNGIRAAVRKGMRDWVAAEAPDVILMQEVRADPEIVTTVLPNSAYTVLVEASKLKGRAGVAVAVRHGLDIGEVRRGLPEDDIPVDTGRWLEVDLPGLTVISAYLHSGVASKPEKMDAKYAHLDRVSARLAELDTAAPILVCGDFNVVRDERGIANWRSNHNRTSGVLDQEIAYLDRWFEAGWSDVQRELEDRAGGVVETDGVKKDVYTWWSQRGKAFDNNVGWRIDYQMATAPLAARAETFAVGRADAWDRRWSDHAPLTVTYDL
ncbi:exodeoxyribonuclease III [Neoactinobaculum massilliense]|uniref:exodeoxyribonuclease III n=1 Tax=Neoactinobaculum massilliense TaxID=2364794 RepID=UPI000F5313F9|nr:exodeoxyribonuclease III [Neoactinobaculum massilliense]